MLDALLAESTKSLMKMILVAYRKMGCTDPYLDEEWVVALAVASHQHVPVRTHGDRRKKKKRT